MRKIILTGIFLLISSFAMAASFSDKQSAHLNAMASAWKATQTTQSFRIEDDLTMVYGGADVASSHLMAA